MRRWLCPILSLQQIKPRSVGAEHVSLEALKELQILEEACCNKRQQAEALGNIIGRMCAPRSELTAANPKAKRGRYKEKRCDRHLFITVLAYQAVLVIRRKLREQEIHESWASLRETLAKQCRITATFRQRDGKTLHIRKATRPEEELGRIY